MKECILAPAFAQAALNKFGTNPYGLPNFRIVWRPSRTYIIGGFWEDNGAFEYRRVQKYGNDPKWVLERWRPAIIYGSPELWEEQTLTPEGFLGLGPFPAHGEYESVEVFTTGRGMSGYVALEPGLIELTARCVVMGRINTYSDIRIAKRDAALAKQAEEDQRFEEHWEAQQHSHKGGLTIGAHARYNQQEEIDDYVRKLEQSGLYVDRNKFRRGFRQN